MKKNILILMAFLLVSIGLSAQDTKQVPSGESNTPEQLSRGEKKALQRQIDSISYHQAIEAINDTAYTLEADQVVFKYGEMAFVSSNTNFVSVKGNHAVVQVAFNIPVAGPNGLGGVTVEGMVTSYKKETDKKGNVYVTMNVMGVGISAQVTITLYADNNQASVVISPNFNSRRLTLNGRIVPARFSNVFKGRSL